MDEEQEITMPASIGSMEGVGPAALEVFEMAGFRTILQLKAFDKWEKPLRTDENYDHIDVILVEFASSNARSMSIFSERYPECIWAKRRSRQIGLKVKKSRRHKGLFRAYKPVGWTIPVLPISTKFRYEDTRHELAKTKL
jgi:hypothetical protein